MDDLINRQAAIEAVGDVHPLDYNGQAILHRIQQLPTIDAVPVVRCKECKHYREGKVLSPQKFCFRLRGRDGEAIGYNFAEDDFCSYGERSEDATD